MPTRDADAAQAATGADPGPAKANGTQAHRQQVQAVATELFAAQGFAATGVREIAARAGVDPALVIRWFGSKEKLFLRTMTMPDTFTAVIAGPLDDLGRRLVDFLVQRTRNEATHVFAALLRASDRPTVQVHLREAVDEMIVANLAQRLPGTSTDLRSRLISAQVTGLMAALHVVQDPGLVSAPAEELVAYYGRAIQLLVDG
ncbi:TetR/AcrR family transcriptional regulator [Rhodococcus sp. D2-41]|uniref:TetR family transcriptional regulator n=1 Tax=Speluncibacter jeojiensis TaxID=2710754 RepID=A0A9X4RD15_9ACTN|nr:TetR family transcriptional regulator [Rhodococcus sp. D2-41]MDG3010382.1 TetR/AcrR family transcriptional regulator [Rhodococcus sp. D2-41]MDG3014119.1 TetR family transcriptional regulator [Corynebacteriales bacterium D3-21]